MWRCFQDDKGGVYAASVFSTHVEMFLWSIKRSRSDACFLHARGDVSLVGLNICQGRQFSPRMWRCFSLLLTLYVSLIVFSTHVEMFPKQMVLSSLEKGFLHVCGDVVILFCIYSF